MAEKKKNELKEKLFYKPGNGYDKLTAAEEKKMNAYCEAYKDFLDHGKTERLCVDYCIKLAKGKGFKEYKAGMKLKAGDKVYFNNRGKAIMLAVIGTESLDKGINLTAAHTDAPRLDLKPNPLYEDAELAYLKTHHYGGIRKYQWLARTLELHGVVILKNGKSVAVNIGGDENDPQFIIEDLLPHLRKPTDKEILDQAVPSEILNVLVGSRPIGDKEDSDRVKLGILKLLNEKYGLVEEDLISAELEVVPAGKARDVGLDRSLIAAYGHDDRVCAYAEMAGLFDAKNLKKTGVCIFADKEEIGSVGVTGMISEAFEWFIGDLCKGQKVDIRDCFANSFCVSADVTAAYDPNYAEVFEARNDAKINHGVAFCKYTGHGGKGGASDASAEVVGKLRKLMNDAGVVWQMTQMGKNEQGGGGTVALDLANRNIDTIDAGVPVLAMHAPIETVAKFDCYMTYKCMKTVFENA
ncbi:MAG: aminopeptidase [Lachnospiraceae bacterium]|nr:aminopeptidase [Lachnospiraceae bacterium]